MPVKSWLLIVVLIVSFGFGNIFCGQGPVESARDFIPNRAPQIRLLSSDYTGDGSDIVTGYSINITVEANDPDGDPVNYTFSGAGSFQDMLVTPEGCEITFIVGNITGGTNIVVNLTVRDDKGLSSSQSLYVAQTALGPVITITDTLPDEVSPISPVNITFQGDRSGYYQIRKNPPLPINADNAFDTALPVWSYSSNESVTINIYPYEYSGEKSDPPPPYITLDAALPDDIYIVVVDRLNQFSYQKVTINYDSTPPVPGNSGLINVDNIQLNSVRLNWQKGTDLVDPQDSLEYKIVFSTSNNIGNVADAEANGQVFQVTPGIDWTFNLSTASITGLIMNTGYYFNVIVRDRLGNKAVYTPAGTTTLNDPDPPVPGGGGAISVSNLTDISLTLSWNKALDAIYPQGSLEYKVVRSDYNNISTLEQIENLGNGTIVCDWTSDLSQTNVQGLTRSKIYYFNVVVRDGAGNKAVYGNVSAATKNTIYLFSTAFYYRGNLEGRNGADQKCIDAYNSTYSSLGATNIHAFLSVNSDDEIRDFPVRYSIPTDSYIRSVNGTLIATSWADLLDGGIVSSMLSSGVVSSFVHYYWTGSNPDGSLAANHCLNWTSVSDGDHGIDGNPDSNGSQWLNYAGNACYSQTRKLIGICW